MLYLPQNVAAELKTKKQIEVQLKRIDNMIATDARKKQMKEEWEKRKRETKPLAITQMVNGRPIVVVGAGTMWHDDMVDLAKRRGETEMFQNGRAFTPLHPMEALRIAKDKWDRQQRGTSVFHIKNNPISTRG